MIWRRMLIPIGVAALLQSSLGLGQTGMGSFQRPNLDPFVPNVGEQIPDLTIVDDQGTPVNIRELAGRAPYTVLTLGCLT